MRIIAGKLRGHRLAGFEAGHIRPTTDRVKESIFNRLQGDLEGARVLDLFAGTGNLGFEAWSRGAREVIAVESHPRSLAIIHKNLEKLKIQDHYSVHRRDVFQYLREYDGEAFDIILVDPPFTKVISHEVMEAMASSKVHGAASIIVIESAKQENVQPQYGSLSLSQEKNFGDKILRFFNHAPN